MEWTTLELRKASVLRKEVDLAIRLIQQAVENDDQNKLEELISSIKERTLEIEEFYSRNDDDDRAILFEKQRLRLRRAIQGLQTASPEKPSKNQSPPKHAMSSQQKPPGSAQQPSPVGRQQKAKTPGGSVGGSTARSSKKGGKPNMPKRAAEPLEPIYPWEMGADAHSFDGNPVTGGAGDSHSQYYHPEVFRDRIYTEEYGAFIPADTHGLYMREEAGGIFRGGDEEEDEFEMMGAGLPDYYVDFQVVLSEAEFDAFVSRRTIEMKKQKEAKANVAAARYRDKTCKESKYLLTQTPYVDPKRVLNDLYRPAQPQKWVDPKGFAVSGAKIRDD